MYAIRSYYGIITTPSSSDISYVSDESQSIDNTITSHSTVPKDYIINETEKKEIQALLTEFKDFSYSYLECKEVKNFISNTDFIKTQEVIKNGVNKGNSYEKKWFKVIGGNITTMSALIV